MAWQDFVIALGQLMLGVALLPAVFGKQKPPISTCLLTGFWLSVFAVCFASLSLIGSAVNVTIAAALWFTMGVQQMWHMKPTRPRHISWINTEVWGRVLVHGLMSKNLKSLPTKYTYRYPTGTVLCHVLTGDLAIVEGHYDMSTEMSPNGETGLIISGAGRRWAAADEVIVAGFLGG